MPLVFWFCFICLNLPEAHTVWLSPSPYLHLSWCIMRKVTSMIHFFSELAATGISDITNSYAENHVSAFFFIQSVVQSLCSLVEMQKKEWYSIIVSRALFWLFNVLCFWVAIKSAFNSFCNDLTMAAFSKAVHIVSCTYIYYIYYFLCLSKYVKTEAYLQEMILMVNHRRNHCLGR